MAVVPFPRRPSVGLPAGPAPPRRFVGTAAGRRIAYAETGAGPPAVLVHGTLMTADDMRLGPMEALARRFHCIAFDRPGHGWSDHVRGADASLWAQAATLRDAVQALGLSRPVICGHSYGGAVALAYGLAYPDEVSGIVALAPICFPEPRLEHLLFGPRAVPAAGDVPPRPSRSRGGGGGGGGRVRRACDGRGAVTRDGRPLRRGIGRGSLVATGAGPR